MTTNDFPVTFSLDLELADEHLVDLDLARRGEGSESLETARRWLESGERVPLQVTFLAGRTGEQENLIDDFEVMWFGRDEVLAQAADEQAVFFLEWACEVLRDAYNIDVEAEDAWPEHCVVRIASEVTKVLNK